MPEISFEAKNNVLIVTFDRPENGNALTTSMAKTFSEKLKAVSEDRGYRALLLKGANNCFMTGHDMSGFAGETNDVQEQIFTRVQFFYAVIREMQVMERPVISAVEGTVSGSGYSLALASDFVIAAQGTVFNPGFTSYAMIPDGGATFFLPRKVGAAKANEILLLNEDMSAELAEKWGIVNKIVPANNLHGEATAFAERLAQGPTRIYGATKRLIGRAFEQDLKNHLSQEATTWTTIGAKTFDFREAMKAFISNRDAKFTGA